MKCNELNNSYLLLVCSLQSIDSRWCLQCLNLMFRNKLSIFVCKNQFLSIAMWPLSRPVGNCCKIGLYAWLACNVYHSYLCRPYSGHIQVKSDIRQRARVPTGHFYTVMFSHTQTTQSEYDSSTIGKTFLGRSYHRVLSNLGSIVKNC